MQATRSILRIGELAERSGLSPDTLRHYERLGLLSASRTMGRFREYRPEAVRRVQVIQAALAMGFSLRELAKIFAERAAGKTPCQRVRAIGAAKLTELTRHIEELTRLRARLESTLRDWDARLAATPRNTPARLLELLVEEEAAASTRRGAARGQRRQRGTFAAARARRALRRGGGRRAAREAAVRSGLRRVSPPGGARATRAIALGALCMLVALVSCSRAPASLPTPPSELPSPERAAAVSSPAVQVWGSLRELMHEGRTEARVTLAEPLGKPHLYAVGALAGMRGEITVLDGAAWLARGGSAGGRATSGDAGESATLLVAAHVEQWARVPIPEDIPFAHLDEQIEALATAGGLDVEQPFPFLIEGTLGDVRWHVLAGEPGRSDPQAPASAPGAGHDHTRNAISGEQATLEATLVGFFSKHHQGVFTHMGQRVHAHVLAPAAALSAHADQFRVRAGSALLLPRGARSSAPPGSR